MTLSHGEQIAAVVVLLHDADQRMSISDRTATSAIFKLNETVAQAFVQSPQDELRKGRIYSGPVVDAVSRDKAQAGE